MKDRKTAAELMAELSRDKDFLEMQRERDIAHKKSVEEHARQSAPVVAALKQAGVNVDSIGKLGEDGELNPKAIPVLLEHLAYDYSDWIRQVILRKLATPHARKYWDQLMEIFEKNSLNLAPEIRYVAALALSGAADDTVLDDVIRLLGDKSLGLDRAPLLIALIRSKSPKAKMKLLELRDDPDLSKQIKTFRRLERHQKANRPPSNPQ
ncbi:HEAT repeat domain-containing protein [Xanthomonas albilineans]|uniref:HEAT repeat domain-containing protein n=1 Tax=Xanthomonas albilineans TaxID=29447 RepID=UPI0005F31AC3|nr:HEAT repeat domain-containing protein [Xanthomonas albilineans]